MKFLGFDIFLLTSVIKNNLNLKSHETFKNPHPMLQPHFLHQNRMLPKIKGRTLTFGESQKGGSRFRCLNKTMTRRVRQLV